MSKVAVALATPYYLLKDGNRCIGPACIQLGSGTEFSAVYGFSNKVAYDNFHDKSPLALTPYPLVKVYLQDQASTADACVRLLVLDAAGPSQLSLQATTMEAVLTAHVKRTNQVTATHHLTFNQDAGCYKVDEVST